MASPPDELIAYVRAETQQGVPAQEIRETLMGAGWGEFEVENALHDVAAGLRPVTEGASIHEDLAQVRGMVSHLATRVQRLETQLVGSAAPALPADQTLHIGGVPEREALAQGNPAGQVGGPAAPPHSGRKVATLLGGMLIAGALGWYFATRAYTGSVSSGALQTNVLVGGLLLLMGYRWMRARQIWAAQLATAGTATLWAIAAWYAWRNGSMEGQNLVALFIFFIVFLLVMGRWIDRFSADRSPLS